MRSIPPLSVTKRPFTTFLRIDKKEVHLSCQSPFQTLLLEVGHVATEFLYKKIRDIHKTLPALLGHYEKEYGSAEREYVISEGCSCGAGFRPGIVLDPFIGAGTTAVVAKKLGRDFIGIDVSDNHDAIKVAIDLPGE